MTNQLLYQNQLNLGVNLKRLKCTMGQAKNEPLSAANMKKYPYLDYNLNCEFMQVTTPYREV